MEQSVFLFGGAALVFGLTLLMAFSNGLRNASMIVATVISTRAIRPNRAFLLCAVGEFLGVVFLGSAVVGTLTKKIFGPVFAGHNSDALVVLGAGLGAAFLWSGFCYWRALPTSGNHAVLAGIAGSSWMAWGSSHLLSKTFVILMVVLLTAPLLGFLLSSFVTWLLRLAGEWLTLRTVGGFHKLHVASSLLVAGVDGSNDGQMALSLALLALSVGHTDMLVGNFHGQPLWLVLTIAGCVALGVLMGGRRVAQKLGMSFYRIEILQGLSAQLSAAGLIYTCLFHGFPTSISQVMTGSILGAGAAKNVRSVRWSLATDIVLSWILTMPVAALLAALFYWVLKQGTAS